jgi:hypothetical protein
VATERQCSCCLVKIIALTTLNKLAVLPHLKFQLILWAEGTKYYSQASHLVRPHQSFSLYANTRIGHLRNNSRIFTKRLKFLCFLKLVGFFNWVSFFILIFIIPVLLTSPSLFSSPYSYPLYFPSFSCATIHCSPSQILFLPLLIHSLP